MVESNRLDHILAQLHELSRVAARAKNDTTGGAGCHLGPMAA